MAWIYVCVVFTLVILKGNILVETMNPSLSCIGEIYSTTASDGARGGRAGAMAPTMIILFLKTPLDN